MNVPNERQKIGRFLADNRFIAIFEEMACPFVTTIIVLSIPGELLSHDRRNSIFAAFKENMDMIGHQDPCVYFAVSCCDIFRKPLHECMLVMIVLKDWRPVYSPDDDVVQCSGCVKAGASGHDVILEKEGRSVNGKHK